MEVLRRGQGGQQQRGVTDMHAAILSNHGGGVLDGNGSPVGCQFLEETRIQSLDVARGHTLVEGLYLDGEWALAAGDVNAIGDAVGAGLEVAVSGNADGRDGSVTMEAERQNAIVLPVSAGAQ